MDLNGVHPRVIHAVNNLQKHAGDPHRHYVNLMDMPLNEREALFVVGFLHGILSSQQQQQQKNSKQQESSKQQTTISLILGPNYLVEQNVYSDEAVDIFCRFLHTTTLTSLHLSSFPTGQLRRLLDALRTNVSLQELKISYVQQEQGGGDALGIAGLLRHKTDFTGLSFDNFYDFEMAQILPFLREGPAHLQTLEFEDCDIDDQGTRLLVDALVNSKSKYESLKTLSLMSNGITSNGLRELSKLDSDALPSLECLNLTSNFSLLDDAESTKLFAQKVLLSPGTTLKELYLRFCSKQAVGYITIIKSLESNERLRALDIVSPHIEHFQAIGDHLILSLPKMKGLQQLFVEAGLLNHLDDESALTAFRKNASLFHVFHVTARCGTQGQFPMIDARLGPILERNKQLVKLDALLGTPTTSTTKMSAVVPIDTAVTTIPPPPCALWAPVLAKVGQGGEGYSPVFKILCNRLATWAAEQSPSNGRCFTKHGRGQDVCAKTQIEVKKRKLG